MDSHSKLTMKKSPTLARDDAMPFPDKTNPTSDPKKLDPAATKPTYDNLGNGQLIDLGNVQLINIVIQLIVQKFTTARRTGAIRANINDAFIGVKNALKQIQITGANCVYSDAEEMNNCNHLKKILLYLHEKLSRNQKLSTLQINYLIKLINRDDTDSGQDFLKGNSRLPKVFTASRAYKGVIAPELKLAKDGKTLVIHWLDTDQKTNAFKHTVCIAKKGSKTKKSATAPSGTLLSVSSCPELHGSLPQDSAQVRAKTPEEKTPRPETDPPKTSSSRDKKIWFSKMISLDDPSIFHRPFLELISEELFRLMLTTQPKTRFGSLFLRSREAFVLMSEGIPGFRSLHQIVRGGKAQEIDQVKQKIESGQSNLGEILVLALWVNEIDLKFGNLGLDANGKIVKIDGDLTLQEIDAVRRADGELREHNYFIAQHVRSANFDITAADLQRLPMVEDYNPHHWLDLIMYCGAKINPPAIIQKIDPATKKVELEAHEIGITRQENFILNPTFLKSHKPFRDEINKAILKIILLEDDLVANFVNYFVPSVHLAKEISDHLIKRKNQLEKAALQNADLIVYLHEHGLDVINDYFKKQILDFNLAKKDKINCLSKNNLADVAMAKLNKLKEQFPLPKEKLSSPNLDALVKETSAEQTPAEQTSAEKKPEKPDGDQQEIDHRPVPATPAKSIQTASPNSSISARTKTSLHTHTTAAQESLHTHTTAAQESKGTSKRSSAKSANSAHSEKSPHSVLSANSFFQAEQKKAAAQTNIEDDWCVIYKNEDPAERLTRDDLLSAINNYCNYKDQPVCWLFNLPIRWLFSSEESAQVAKKLKDLPKEADKERYHLAMQYIEKYPKRAFSIELMKVIAKHEEKVRSVSLPQQ